MINLRIIGSLIFLLVGAIGLPYLTQHQDAAVGGTTTEVVDLRQAGRTAILSIVPGIGRFGATTPQSLAVRVDSGGSLVARVSFTISYPPDRVSISEVNFASSFCTIEPTVSINNKQGIVSVTCTANSPGLTAQIGTVATLITTPVSAGDAPFQFDQARSNVIARETNKDVLSYAVDRIISYGDNPANQITITSLSHPAGISCSYKSTTDLAWLKQEGAETFEYGWSEEPSFEPNTKTSSTSLSLPTKPGTTQFFSLRGISSNGTKGPISRYRVASCR